MKYGVHLPQLGRSADRQAMVTWAEEADRLGLHSVWVSDHIAWPRDLESRYPYSDDGSFPGGYDMPWLDPLASLAFVAARTEHVRLGTTVLILGYRPPLLTGKWVSTIDVLSGGRTILGVGVGWMREEFEVLGMPFDHRGARADEQLEVFDALFTQPEPSFDGRFYSFGEIGFSPKPVQAKVPVWVGGNSPGAWRRAARYGDAFHAAFETMDAVADGWQAVSEACEELGRDRAELELSVRLYLDPQNRMPAEKSLQGSTEQMLDTAGRWAEMGVDHILLDVVASGGADGRLDAWRTFITATDTSATAIDTSSATTV